MLSSLMCVFVYMLRVADDLEGPSPRNGYLLPHNGHSPYYSSSDDDECDVDALDDVTGGASCGACAARRTSSMFALGASRLSHAIAEVDEGEGRWCCCGVAVGLCASNACARVSSRRSAVGKSEQSE